MKLADTSLFIEHERGQLMAAERIAALLEEGLAVCAVTTYELTCSASLPPSWADFYEDLFRAVEVLPVTHLSSELAARAARGAPGIRPPDALIAGVALEHGLTVVTADADFARLGVSMELLRLS